MKIIEKLFLFCCLLGIILNVPSSLSVQPDFTDTKYLELKDELLKAVEDNEDLDTIKKKFEEIFDVLWGKFVPNIANLKERDDYLNNIKPSYLKNLLNQPKGASIIDAALKNHNLTILNFLLKEKNPKLSDKDFFNYLDKYLDKHLLALIDPSTDKSYLEQKKLLIAAIKKNDTKLVKELLSKFTDFFRNRFTPNIAFNIQEYRLTKIQPIYLEDLYPDLITTAIDSNNSTVIYVLLENLINEENSAELFKNFVSSNPSIVEKLLKLKEQPVYDEVDCLIILVSSTYIHLSDVIEFLENIKNAGIDNNRMENNILKAFAQENIALDSNIISELLEKKLIATFDVEDYKQYIIFYNIISALSSKRTIKKAKQLVEDLTFIDKKDSKGDSLLITATDSTPSDEQIIEFTKMLVTKKYANVNQAGKASLTPLMHAVQAKFHRQKQEEQINLIEFLITSGASLEAKDVFGKTALDYAKESKNAKIIETLKKQPKSEPTKLLLQEQIVILNNLNSTLISLANKK